MDNEILVKTIKNTCKNFGITVAQLEKEMGYSPSLISRWTKTSPSIDKIVEIADYFNIPIDELIGRTLKHDNTSSEQFIDTLFSMTVNKSLEWSDATKFIPKMEHDENFDLEDEGYDNREIFTTSYNNGYFWVYAQYSEEKGYISESYVEIYVQPNKNSKMVLQNVDADKAKNLWMYVHTLLFGSLDEIKAEEFKSTFMFNESFTNSDNIISQVLNNKISTESFVKALDDPTITKLKKFLDDPKFQEFQKTFSNPKVWEALRMANKLQNYFDKNI